MSFESEEGNASNSEGQEDEIDDENNKFKSQEFPEIETPLKGKAA